MDSTFTADPAEASSIFEPGGKIMLEFGDRQAVAIREIFESQKWSCRSKS